MKKAVTFFTLLLLVSFVIPVSATEEATTSNQIRETIRQRQEERRRKLEQLREAVQEQREERREAMEAIRAEYREKLEEIRDARKKTIVEKLDQAYANINNRWITHFLNVLERLEKILAKLEIKAESQGNTEAITAINAAHEIINAYRTAVEEQAERVYTIEISDETTLREAAQTVHRQLKDDLTALREKVKNAREAVHQVFILLANAENE